jgi:hypothetical protein
MPYAFNPITGNLDYYRNNFLSDMQFGATDSAWRGIFDIFYTTTVAGPPAASIDVHFGSGSFFDDGYSYTFNIYAYKGFGASRVYSGDYQQVSYSDPGTSSQNYYFDILWDAVNDADGYLVVVVEDNYDGYFGDYSFDVSNVNIMDYGLGAEYNGTYDPYTTEPTSIGPNLYVDSTSGTLISNAGIEATTGVFSSTLASKYHTITINETDHLNGAAITINNTNPAGQNGVRSIIDGQTLAVWRTDYIGGVNWIGGTGTTTTSGVHDFYVEGDYPSGKRLFALRSPYFSDGGSSKCDMGSIGFLNNIGTNALTEFDIKHRIFWDTTKASLLIAPGTKSSRANVESAMTDTLVVEGTGKFTGTLKPRAGTATAATQPIKFTSGTLLTSPEAGSLEFLNDDFFVTQTSSTVRKKITTVSASADLTAQGAAIAATTVYAVPANGASVYKVTWVATITRAATTSSVLGGTNGFQIKYTDNDDSVVKTSVAANSITSVANTTGTSISGCLIANCKASTNLQYQFDYTSVGATTMQYNLHVRVEAI